MTFRQVSYQITFAFLGAFWGFILFLGAIRVFYCRNMLRAFDTDYNTGVDTFLVSIMVTSVVLSLVLALHGRRKGRRLAMEPSESGGAQASSIRDLEGIILYLIVGAIGLILGLLFLQTMYALGTG